MTGSVIGIRGIGWVRLALIGLLLAADQTGSPPVVERSFIAPALAAIATPIRPQSRPLSLLEQVEQRLSAFGPLLPSGKPPVRMMRAELGALGSLSIGLPNRGLLLNGVQVEASEHWRVVDPERAYATEETVLLLTTALEWFYTRDPAAPVLTVGQLSKKGGGWLKRHKSHQSGRDVDLGLFYLDESPWYTVANDRNFDIGRTFSLVEALIDTGHVEYIFLDRSLVDRLRSHAADRRLDDRQLARMFYDGSASPLGVLRHAYGHRTHLHVRFINPRAEEQGRWYLNALVASRLIPRRRYY